MSQSQGIISFPVAYTFSILFFFVCLWAEPGFGVKTIFPLLVLMPLCLIAGD